LALGLIFVAVTSAGAATSSMHRFDPDQARAEEHPYVVEGSIAYTVILPAAAAAAEPNRDFAAIAEQARQTAACADALTASTPGAVEQLAEALASDALLPELQYRIERAAQSRAQSSPVLIGGARGENDSPAETALADASQRQVLESTRDRNQRNPRCGRFDRRSVSRVSDPDDYQC